MRKVKFLCFVALMGVLALADTGHAISISQGEIQVSFNDDSSLFYLDEGETDAADTRKPRPLTGTLPSKGDENRAIFEATRVENLDTGENLWQPSSTSELTGIFYDLELTNVSSVPQGTRLDFQPLNRNAVSNVPAGYGGVIEIYAQSGDSITLYDEDPNNARRYDQDVFPNVLKTNAQPPIPLDPNAGPYSWVEGEGSSARDQFPTVTDGQLWLQAVFVPASVTGDVAPPGTVLTETINLGSGTGSGSGYAMITGGSAAGMFTPGFYGPTMDLTIGFSTHTAKLVQNDPDVNFDYMRDRSEFDGRGYWQINSTGSASAHVIPEPATFGLLGLALIGVGGAVFFRRHQRG